MKDYNILVIDDIGDHIKAVQKALVKCGYSTNNIYPKKNDIVKHSQMIRNFAIEEKYTDMYFYIVKLIEKNKISAIFLDLNHDKDKATTSDKPKHSSGEKLVKSLISNHLYKIPIVIYSRYAKDNLELDSAVELHVGMEGVLSMEDVTSFTSTEVYDSFTNEVNRFDKKRVDTKVIEYSKRKYNCDVAIVCALTKEYQSVKNIIDIWKTDGRYDHAFIEDEKSGTILKVVLTSMGDYMGMVEASYRSVNLIDYAKPKYLGMSGIAGGNKNSGAYLGDICIAENLDNWQSGKYSNKNGEHIEISPEYRSIPEIIKDILEDMGRAETETKIPLIAKIIHEFGIKELESLIDEEIIQDKEYIKKIKKDNTLGKEEKAQKIQKIEDNIRRKLNYPEIKVKDMMTGSSLVANERIITEEMENRNRKAFFFDMEGYAVARIATSKKLDGAVVIKSIVDYGNHMKGDKWHNFACDASAKVLIDLMMVVKAKEYKGLL